jgi:methylmalonyl-CoA/ethylmalonyl-CoA epimerase
MPQRIDHIGVVVDNLPEARAFLTVLGMTLDHEFDLGRVEAAFYRCGDVMIEIIECKTPDERERRLGSASARIEHIAIQVDDLCATVDQFASLGVEMTRPDPVRQDDIQSYWTKPETSDGVMYQLFEKLATAAGQQTAATSKSNEVEL